MMQQMMQAGSTRGGIDANAMMMRMMQASGGLDTSQSGANLESTRNNINGEFFAAPGMATPSALIMMGGAERMPPGPPPGGMPGGPPGGMPGGPPGGMMPGMPGGMMPGMQGGPPGGMMPGMPGGPPGGMMSGMQGMPGGMMPGGPTGGIPSGMHGMTSNLDDQSMDS